MVLEMAGQRCKWMYFMNKPRCTLREGQNQRSKAIDVQIIASPKRLVSFSRKIKKFLGTTRPFLVKMPPQL
jgi:hypothetical protein